MLLRKTETAERVSAELTIALAVKLAGTDLENPQGFILAACQRLNARRLNSFLIGRTW